MRKTAMLCTLAVIVAGSLQCAFAAEISVKAATRLKGGLRPQPLKKPVTIEGYYCDDTIPMIVDSMERVGSGTILPRECYVPIDGIPKGKIRTGDKIKVTGGAQAPDPKGPRQYARESVIFRPTSTSAITITKATAVKVVDPQIKLPETNPKKLAHANSYALLIGGGYDAASNHPRWAWTVTCAYRMLISKGYSPGNIIVLYTDGQKGHIGVPVDGSNQRSSIDAAITSLAGKMNDNSTLYILVACPGGGLLTSPHLSYEKGLYDGAIDVDGDEPNDNYSEKTLDIDINGDGDKKDTLSIDETFWGWGESVTTDDQFRTMLNKVQHYSKMIVQLDQAFSGGFVEDLIGPRRIVMSATRPDRLSPSMYPYGYLSPFSYFFVGANLGITPMYAYGYPQKVSADYNRDGKVSIAEAFNTGWAWAAQKKSILACYDDNGSSPMQFKKLPEGGDGTLGAETAL